MPPTAAKRSSHALIRVIADLAARQHGVVARWQLSDIGLTRHQIAHLVAAGVLHPLYRAVFAVGHRNITQEAHWLAAVLAGGHGAVLRESSAAALWRMLPRRKGPIHIAVPRKRRNQSGLQIAKVILDPRDICTRTRIPVTSPERTLLDIAATSPELLDKAVREAHYLRLISQASLRDAVERNKGRAGCKAFRKAIGEADLHAGPTKQELERRFRNFLRTHKLPLPRFNAALEIGETRIEVDCLWPRHRLVVELDSRAAHATPHAFEADRARDRALVAAGYRVIRITWRQLHDDPHRIAEQLSVILTG